MLFLGVSASLPEHRALPCQVAAEAGSFKTLSDTGKIIQSSPLNTARSLSWPIIRLLAIRKAICLSRAMSGDVYSLVFARETRHLLDIFYLLFIHSRSYEEVGRKTPMSWLSLH